MIPSVVFAGLTRAVRVPPQDRGEGQEVDVKTGAEVLRSCKATGNALPVLHEICQALKKLLDTGQPTVIDLGAIPFAGGDERMMDEVLGTGEARAVLDLSGESHVHETGISGVWRVDHFDSAGETQSRFVEVAFVPGILKTQAQDASDGLARLTERLQQKTATQNEWKGR